MNVFKNIFSRRKKWNAEHIEYWKDELILDNDGYSKFQLILFTKVKTELNDLNLGFTSEITEHPSLDNKDTTVKMITLTLCNLNDSKIWIYHDMAEYDLMNTHHIFEKWGYLKPVDLRDQFINLIKTEIIKTAHNKTYKQ